MEVLTVDNNLEELRQRANGATFSVRPLPGHGLAFMWPPHPRRGSMIVAGLVYGRVDRQPHVVLPPLHHSPFLRPHAPIGAPPPHAGPRTSDGRAMRPPMMRLLGWTVGQERGGSDGRVETRDRGD
uniref:Uncharacterized protein n=1 Tax=Vitrella brassicaformis TaxID=1169539 RepID=A0A7S1JUF1_9ALVE